MKYKNTLTDARKYNRTKNPKTKTGACSDCGETIPMNGETCVSFGVYACQVCQKKKTAAALVPCVACRLLLIE